MKHILSELIEFREFMKKFPKRILNVISYPQYLLFLLELDVIINLFFVIDKKTVLHYLILISWGFLSLIALYLYRNLSCGRVNEQIKGNRTKEIVISILNPKTIELELSNFKVEFLKESLFISSFTIRVSFIATILDSINNQFIGEFLLLSVLILTACESMVYLKKISPFLFFPLFLCFSIIVYEIRIDKAVINWTLLLLLFGTTIGSNFFDKKLVNNRISDNISEENLILRKISLYIGLVFLYIGVYISDKVIDSPFYFYFTSKLSPSYNLISNMMTKGVILALIFANYWTTHKIISYLILRICYRNKKFKISSDLVQVKLEEGEWEVKDVKLQESELNKLEIISIDTYQIRGDNKDIYYVSQTSEIPKKIEGLSKYKGYPILGVISRNKITVPLVIVTLLILPAISILDSKVKVDNGIYYIYRKSGNIDSSDAIEISDDTIIYKGKAETFDTRKQSFSMGKVKKNDSNIITVKFYITGKEVQYIKLSGYSGSW